MWLFHRRANNDEGNFQKKIQTGSFCSFRSSTLKICTFSLSVFAFLKWCLKTNVSLCISAHVVLTWSFSMWQGSAEKCPQCCLFCSPSVTSLVTQLSSPPSSLCFVLSSVFAPEWIILYPRHLWNRFQQPHSPIQASLPPCACAYFIFCQESILLIPPAGQRLFYISIQCLFLHEAFPPLSTFSKPRQKAASRGGRKLIFVVLWTWESHLGPAIYLQAGGAWSVTETPCLPFSVSNFHPLRILWGVNVTAGIKALVWVGSSRN